MPAPFEILTRRRISTEGILHLYVHSGSGSDSLAGTSSSTPLATLEEALARIPTLLWGRRVVIHVLAGHSETIVRPLVFPPILGSSVLDDVALDGAEPSWDYIRPQIMIQAEPVTVQNITGTLSAASVHGMQTITVPGAGWTTNEHVGRGVINPGAPAEIAMIWGNTATELFVSSTGLSDGTLRIVRRDATFVVGDVSAFVSSGLMFNGVVSSVALVGLTIRNPGSVAANTAMNTTSITSLSLLFCELDGGFQCNPGSGVMTMDSCYIHDGAFGPNGQALSVRGSYLSALSANYHGSGGSGLFDMISCRINACGSMGHGGTSLPDGGFAIDQCWISNSTSHGILYRGGAPARVSQTVIDSSNGNAINADGCGNLRVVGVTGTGNTGYGCYIDRGAIIEPSSTPTVTGASGEVRLGGSGGTTYLWTQTPQVHSRLCMF
jgi:hypothetical protein